jgi:putative PIN family toxin of toxin-antitoxin system
MAQRSKPPRVFFDTNVLFSALYSSRGKAAELVRSALAGEIDIVISQEVISELSRNLARKGPHLLGAMRELVLASAIEIVPDPPDKEITRWRDAGLGTDAPIVAAALMAEVDYLCTGDQRLLDRASLIERAGLRVVTPGELLEALA